MIRPPIRAMALAVLLFSLAGGARAGSLVDAATTAENLVAQAKYLEAIDRLDAAKDEVWAAAPMSFRKALFTAAQPQAFGVYDLKEGSTFRRNEPLIIYSEPVAYGYGRDGDFYLITLVLDFAVRDHTGKEIARQDGFGTLAFRSRYPNKEFMAKVTYNFAGLPAGDYEVETTAHDQNSGKSASFTLKFTLTD